MRDQFACVDDLKNYFKKRDLLSGLTASEQLTLRRNIGIIEYTGEGSLPEPISLTYALFNDLLTTSNLITGAIYAINDYQTIYSSNVYNSAGQKITWGKDINPSLVWTIYVRATSSNLICKNVTIKDKDWEVQYDPKRQTLEDGQYTKGKITYLRDTNGNSAYYDFKNVRWLWSKTKLRNAGIFTNKDLHLYTFSEIVNGEVQDSSELHNTKYNNLELDCYNNVFIGDTYYNILLAECYNNLFAKGAHDCFFKWNTTNNIFSEPVCYTTGSIYDKELIVGNTVLSSSISKTVHKVDFATIVSFLDPTTYAYLVVII